MRTIRVTGRGQRKLHPDLTRITITLEGSFTDYEQTLQRSSEDTEQLRSLLGGFGFAPQDLKTLSFNVDTQYEGYQENGVFRQRFTGYLFRHEMTLEFDSDNALLGRILYALSASPVRPTFQIGYTVKDPEAAKNQLLEQAVRDAAGKAAVLCRAAGASLKGIASIDYSWGQPNLETRPVNRLMMAEGAALRSAKASLDVNIQPEDIEVSDTVTVVWEIEPDREGAAKT